MSRSFRPKIPTLRDTLLRAAALNFENIFLNSDRVRNYDLKKDIQLPPRLFEDIQSKGNEIGWPIADQFLKPCLACRDALNWVNVDLLLGHYEEKDLVKIKKSRLPLKKFYFRVYRMTSKLMLLIRKYSRTLEVLHLGCHRTKSTENEEKVYKKPIKFPILKSLIIDYNIESLDDMFHIDFASLSDTLESLNVYCNYGFEDSMKHFYSDFCKSSLRKLISFAFTGVHICEAIKPIEQCSNLRTLCLVDLLFSEVDMVLKPLLNNLPFLEYLDLGFRIQIREGIEFLKPKNLKYLSFLEDEQSKYPDIENYAQTVCAHGANIDSVLTNLEYSSFTKTFILTTLTFLIKRLKVDSHSVTCDQWQKIEMIILYLVQCYWVDSEGENFLYANMLFSFAESTHQWSTDFMGKFANLIVNFAFNKKMDFEEDFLGNERTLEQKDLVWVLSLLKSRQLLNYMLEHITMKPNTTIGRTYLNFILLSNIYYHYSIDTEEFVKSTRVKIFPSEYSEI